MTTGRRALLGQLAMTGALAITVAACASSARSSRTGPSSTSTAVPYRATTAAPSAPGTHPVTASSPPALTATTESRSTVMTIAPTEPVLGANSALNTFAQAGTGFGQAEPSTIYLGGDPTGMVNHVVWQSWGGPEARATGVGYWVGPGQLTSQATTATADVVALRLGTCGSRYMYQAVEWYFPGHGESFDPSTALNICDAGRGGLDHPTSGVEFLSPTSGISCQIDYGPPYPDQSAYCQSTSSLQSATLAPTGTYKSCAGADCIGNPANVSVLAYGMSVALGPFTCTSATNGMTCQAAGKGFRISATGIVVAPA